MPTKKLTQRNTKAEILAAFNDLMSQNKELETQLKSAKQAKKQTAVAEINGARQNGLEQHRFEGNGHSKSASVEISSTNPAQPGAQNVEAIIEGLSRLQLGFGGAVSDLSEKLVQAAVHLEQIQQTVTEEADQLKLLHDLQITETDLDELFQQYQENAKTYDTELTERKETVEQTITEARKAWLKEQAEHRRTEQVRNATQSKLQRRDAEEYEYTLTREYKLSDETYEQQKERLYLALEEQLETQEKQWDEREKAVAQREAELAELKAKVETQPEKLKSAIKRAKEEGKGIANHQTKVKADLAAKETEGQTRAYDLQIQSLQETIQTQDSRLQTLSKQLDAALKQVQDLAVKAIEGASNASSFQAVKEIAIEQAKTQNKGK